MSGGGWLERVMLGSEAVDPRGEKLKTVPIGGGCDEFGLTGCSSSAIKVRDSSGNSNSVSSSDQ